MARHKWALSGTPVLNRLEELYPYFKFLGVPHTGSFKIFKNNYCGGGGTYLASRNTLYTPANTEQTKIARKDCSSACLSS